MTKPDVEPTLDPEAEASIEQIAEGLRRYLTFLLRKGKGLQGPDGANEERKDD